MSILLLSCTWTTVEINSQIGDLDAYVHWSDLGAAFLSFTGSGGVCDIFVTSSLPTAHCHLTLFYYFNISQKSVMVKWRYDILKHDHQYI